MNLEVKFLKVCDWFEWCSRLKKAFIDSKKILHLKIHGMFFYKTEFEGEWVDEFNWIWRRVSR